MVDERLIQLFGSETIKGVRPYIIVPAYEIESRRPTTFTSEDSTRIIDVVGAALSAPLYFPPARVLRGNSYHHYSDGGLFANNPAMTIITKMKAAGKVDSLANLFVISIGTCITGLDNHNGGVESHSLLRYGELIDGVGSAAAQVTDDHARDLLGANNYFRATYFLSSDIPFDNADRDIIELLISHSEVPEAKWDELKALLRNFWPEKFPGAL